jgi:hypothetical protein
MALVSANPLTAATAMKCFNMCASSGEFRANGKLAAGYAPAPVKTNA